MLKVKRDYEAFLDQMYEIVILLPIALHQENKSFFLNDNNGSHRLAIKEKVSLGAHVKYICQHEIDFHFGQTYYVVDENECKTDLQIGAVIRTKPFDELFQYNGDDLGVTYSKENSQFAVWAPTATSLQLRLYDENHQSESYNMKRHESGVWTVTLQGDYEGLSYSFLACVNLIWREAVDPYAKAVTINGEYGVIVNHSNMTVIEKKLPAFESKTDAIIYEAHIRDFSIHKESGMIHKGKYKAWTEQNTINSNGDSTGITYLKELGITHVELLPINDFEEVDEFQPNASYNWGYNPLHFFAPEGSYSLNPSSPTERIHEVKALVQALHEKQLRVILDVVYNHVYSKEESSFEKLVPGYYFRYDENGNASNGTGVGNDLASERFMVRKFIVDCAAYWLQEYDIDGFRFDLMGIHDVDTMNALQEKIALIKPDAILLGEGWDLNTPLSYDMKAIIPNASKIPKISFFNDEFRDVVKGSTFSLNDSGYAYANEHVREQMKQLIKGSLHKFQSPAQSINYVESHDNHTMWDRFLCFSPDESAEMKMARHRLATSVVILSQGVPFLHAGQEFFRTKDKVENSYNSPDEINWLNWNNRSLYKENVDYVKGLIRLRKLHGAFRFKHEELINRHFILNEHDKLLAYHLKDVQSFGPWSSIYVVHHNHLDEEYTLPLPDGKWHTIVTPERICLDDSKSNITEGKVKGIGTYVFCQN